MSDTTLPKPTAAPQSIPTPVQPPGGLSQPSGLSTDSSPIQPAQPTNPVPQSNSSTPTPTPLPTGTPVVSPAQAAQMAFSPQQIVAQPQSPAQLPFPPASVGTGQTLAPSSLPPEALKPHPTTAPFPGGAPTQNPKPQSQQSAPAFAKPRQSMLKMLILGIVVLVVIGVGAFLAMNFLGGSSEPPPISTPSQNQPPSNNQPPGQQPAAVPPGEQITLEYWGLWEPEEVMQPVLAEFESQNPGIQVRYVQQSYKDYRERLKTAVASGNGPDLFRFHASWAPMLQNELAPMPAAVLSVTEYAEIFYPVASRQLQRNNQIVGIPLMYDGIGLFINTELFSIAGIEPPRTWVELRAAAQALTLKQGNTITRGGIALGTATNVDHFAEVIFLLALQNGADPQVPNTKEFQDALQFYTNFAKTDRVWSDTLPSSTMAFAREEAAMMFAPSWRAHEIIDQNPDLAFTIIPIPRLGSEQIGVANYWAEGVNSKNQNQAAAWKLLAFLSSSEGQKQMYADQSQIRAFGAPYARVDLAEELMGNQYLSGVIADAPYADSWYLNSSTHDKGLNDNLIQYYEDAVSALLQNRQMTEVVGTLETGTTQVLRQYNATGAR